MVAQRRASLAGSKQHSTALDEAKIKWPAKDCARESAANHEPSSVIYVKTVNLNVWQP
jgi:hypothetical protein